MYKFKAPTRATNIRGDQEEKIVFKIIETSGNLGNIVIIIYNYNTGKLREFYFTKGSQDQFSRQNWSREPGLKKNFNFLKK